MVLTGGNPGISSKSDSPLEGGGFVGSKPGSYGRRFNVDACSNISFPFCIFTTRSFTNAEKASKNLSLAQRMCDEGVYTWRKWSNAGTTVFSATYYQKTAVGSAIKSIALNPIEIPRRCGRNMFQLGPCKSVLAR